MAGMEEDEEEFEYLPLFPNDVLSAIFEYGDHKLLASCAGVAPQWQEVVYQDFLWKTLVLHTFAFASSKSDEVTWRFYYMSQITGKHRWRRGAPRDFKMMPMRGHTDYVTCAVLLDPLVFSGSADSTVRVWRKDYEQRKFHEALSLPHVGKVDCVVPYENQLCTGDSGGNVRRWDLDRATAVATGAQGSLVTSMAVDEDNEMIVTGGFDGVIKVWDADLNCVDRLPGAGPVGSVHCQWDKKQQIVSTDPGGITVWDTRAADKHLFRHSLGGIVSADWNPTSDDVVVGTGRHVTVFDTKRGQIPIQLNAEDPVTCVRRVDDHVVAGTEGGMVMLWSYRSGNRHVAQGGIARLDGHRGRINSIALDDLKVVSASADNSTMLHDIRNGERLFALHGGSMRVFDHTRIHPTKPWCSSVAFDTKQVLVAVNNLLRAYDFSESKQ